MWQLIYNLHAKKPLVLLDEYSWDCCVNYSGGLWFDDASLFGTHKGLRYFRTYPIMGSDTFSTLHVEGCLYSKLYPAPLVKTALHFSHTSSHTALRLALKWARVLCGWRDFSQWEFAPNRAFKQAEEDKRKDSSSPSVTENWELFLLCPIIWHPQPFFSCLLAAWKQNLSIRQEGPVRLESIKV